MRAGEPHLLDVLIDVRCGSVKAVGNERLLAALARVKSYLDYGAYTPIQVAAAAALNGPDDCVREMRATYKRRRDVMSESFAAAG